MNHLQLFNTIAPAYAWFYRHQVTLYTKLFTRLQAELPDSIKTVLDVGCGTGAMCQVFSQQYQTTGVDGSEKMLIQAKKHTQGAEINFQLVDFTQGLPFADQSFDLVYASFVAHGVPKQDREVLINEMKRVSKHVVVLFDYDEGRHWIINLVEWLEHGDYFNFVKHFKQEWAQHFAHQKIIAQNKYSALYIGKTA